MLKKNVKKRRIYICSAHSCRFSLSLCRFRVFKSHFDLTRQLEHAETAETERYRQSCVPNRHFFGLAALFTVLAESKI